MVDLWRHAVWIPTSAGQPPPPMLPARPSFGTPPEYAGFWRRFAADLNANNTVVPGEVGIESGAFGARIYGVETDISPQGIALYLPLATHSGLPVVQNGRVELTQIEAGDDLLGFVMSGEMFEEAMEGGINRALHAHGLTPCAIRLETGADAALTARWCIAGCRPRWWT